ncbi:MAG TPA: hypothetical protein VGP47_02815 [Parachlamydiaceae bacterium]|nr:hypothetical protein [Parachlamydiaceae bacterium]
MYTTRTPVNGSGFCSNGSMFGPTVTRRPVGGAYTRPSFGSGFGSSFGSGFGGGFGRTVTRTPVFGSGYYGNSLFGSSPFGNSSYYSTPTTYYPSHYPNYSCRPVDGGLAALAGLVTGVAVFASLL